jgi:dolichol-phosphate mannosyltransferase
MKGLVILVNYEQEVEIGRFLDRLTACNPGLEVVLVDDGSRDRSPDIARSHGLEVLHHEANRGVGSAIRTGIRFAQERGGFDYVLIMSTNGKMHPEEMKRVIEPILLDEADYVQGSRFLEEGRSLSLSAFRSLAIPAYSLFASVILRRRFTDITCGYRAYRLAVLDNPRINLDQPWLDHYEAELYIHYHVCRQGWRTTEVPVTIDYSHLQPGRRSKMRAFTGWWSLARPFLLLASGLRR